MAGRVEVTGFFSGDKSVRGLSLNQSLDRLSFLSPYHRKFLSREFKKEYSEPLKQNLGKILSQMGQLVCDNYEHLVRTFHGSDTLLGSVPKFYVSRGETRHLPQGSYDKMLPGGIIPEGTRVSRKGTHPDDFSLMIGFSVRSEKYSDKAIEIAYQREFGTTTRGNSYIEGGGSGMIIPLYGHGHQIATTGTQIGYSQEVVNQWKNLPAKYRYSAASLQMRTMEKAGAFGGNLFQFYRKMEAATLSGTDKNMPRDQRPRAGRWVKTTSANVRGIFVVDVERLHQRSAGSPFAIYGGGRQRYHEGTRGDVGVLSGGSTDDIITDADAIASATNQMGISSEDAAGMTESAGLYGGADDRVDDARDRAATQAALMAEGWKPGDEVPAWAALAAGQHDFSDVSRANTSSESADAKKSGETSNTGRQRHKAAGVINGTNVGKSRMLSAMNLKMAGMTLNLVHEEIASTGILPSSHTHLTTTGEYTKSFEPGGTGEGTDFPSKYQTKAKEVKSKQKYDGALKPKKRVSRKMRLPDSVNPADQANVIYVAGVSQDVNVFNWGHPVATGGAEDIPLSNYYHKNNPGGLYKKFAKGRPPSYDEVEGDIYANTQNEGTHIATTYGVTTVTGHRGSAAWKNTALANVMSLTPSNHMVNKNKKGKKSRLSRFHNTVGMVHRKKGTRSKGAMRILHGSKLTTGDARQRSRMRHAKESDKAHAELFEMMKVVDMPVGVLDANGLQTSFKKDPRSYALRGIRKNVALFAAVNRVRVGAPNQHMQNAIRETGPQNFVIDYNDLLPQTMKGETDKRYTRFRVPRGVRGQARKMKVDRQSILDSWVATMQAK